MVSVPSFRVAFTDEVGELPLVGYPIFHVLALTVVVASSMPHSNNRIFFIVFLVVRHLLTRNRSEAKLGETTSTSMP
jgi:hypothetical protein